MRKVVNNSEVPHLWAHQTQDEARNSTGSLYFNGKTIFSYGSHFPIATHVVNARGEKAILFTTANYSVTTSGHKSNVHSAIPAGVDVFDVNLEGFRCVSVEMLDEYNERIQKAEKEAARARDEWRKNYRLSDAAQLHNEAHKFAKFFDFDESKIVELTGDLEAIKAAIKAENTRKRTEEKERKATALREQAEAIATWRNGGSVWSSFRDIDTMLRVAGDTVETSRGAVFPVSHAKKGLTLVRAVMARGEEWKTNGHTCHLGHYRVDRITANGTVYAGCHVVTWAEIERISAQLDAIEG